MFGIFDYIRGAVRIEVVCHSAERFLNICAQLGIKFRRIEKIDKDTIRMTVTPDEYKRLAANENRYGYILRLLDEKGAVFTAKKLHRRYVLVGGLLACVAALILSSLFIWEMDVTGNEKFTEQEILAKLDELGVGIGTCRIFVSQEYISNEMPQKMKGISFIAVNVTGSRAEVIVREERSVPDIADTKTDRLVCAEMPGVITKMTVLEGTPMYKVGDEVKKGDTLVASSVESVSSGTRIVSASAEVYARTQREITAEMPLVEEQKVYDGRENSRFALILCGKRINLYFNGGKADSRYDKITMYNNWEINGISLPVQIVKESVRQYDVATAEREQAEAEEILKQSLLESLEEELGDDGEIIKSDFTVSMEEGVISVTLHAECVERIDMTRALTEEEKTAGKEENDGGENDQR